MKRQVYGIFIESTSSHVPTVQLAIGDHSRKSRQLVIPIISDHKDFDFGYLVYNAFNPVLFRFRLDAIS